MLEEQIADAQLIVALPETQSGDAPLALIGTNAFFGAMLPGQVGS